MKVKIRFVINTVAGGGAEKVFSELLKNLDPDVYEIRLVSVTKGVHSKDIPSYVRYRCIVPGKGGPLGRFLGRVVRKLPPRLFATLFLRGKNDFEIAYLEGLPTRYVAVLRTNAKKIAFIHCDLATKNLIAPLYRDREACLAEYRSFDRVCFVSNQCYRGFETAFGTLDKGCVVHNVLNYDRVREMATLPVEEAYTTGGMKLITVGRLSEPKAFDRLLRIVSQLETRYDLELWVLGEGDERAKLESVIRERDIRSVRLLGYRTNPYAYMRQADLYVCSSIYEGYSTVVTESLTLGVPVLTTNCAGMEEILENGRVGKIVPNDEEALLRGLEELLNDPKEFAYYREMAEEKGRTLSNRTALDEFEALLR